MLAIFPARIRGKIAGILAKAANMPDNPLPVGDGRRHRSDYAVFFVGQTAVNIALNIDIDTARGASEGLPRLLDVLQQHHAQATVCMHLGRDAGAPRLEGANWRTRGRLYGWGSLLRGRLWPGQALASHRVPACLAAVRQAGCETGLRLAASRTWGGTLHATGLNQRLARFRQLTASQPDSPLVVSLPHGCASWPLLRLAQQCGVSLLTGVAGQAPFMPVYRAERVEVAVAPITLPSLWQARGKHAQPGDDAVAALLADTESSRATGQLYCASAELEGGPWLAQFDQLLAGWRAQGHQLLGLTDWLNQAPALPHHAWEMHGPRHAAHQGAALFQLADTAD